MGIIIGVAAVTAVIAALTGLKTSVLSEFETFGTNKIFILPFWGDDRGPRRDFRDNRVRFKPEIFDELLEHCPSIARFTRLCDFNTTIAKGKSAEQGVEITGIEPAWHQIENREVIMGRPFSLIDNQQARPVCIINDRAQEKLRLPRDPVGDWIMIGNRRFTVVGVIKARAESSMFGGNFSCSEVFVPFSTARVSPHMGMICIAATKSPALTEEAKAELTFFMRRQRGLRVDEENTFRIESV